MGRPTLVYDGGCGFCTRWVGRWKHLTGDAVSYEPAAEGTALEAVRFIDADGTATEAAAAVFKALEHAPFPWRAGSAVYRRFRGFAWAAEILYRFVARNRVQASRLTRLLWGDDLAPPTFHLARWLVVKGVALCFFLAFVSFAAQWEGLVGSRGIAPAAELLVRAREALGRGAWLELPTLFWLTGASDSALAALSWGGAALSVAVMAGFYPALGLASLWALYMSVYSVGWVFLGFQWDVLLLEAGVLAALAAPWGRRPSLASEPAADAVPLWLVRWLWFRLMVLAGSVKLASGDAVWWDLTALSYHFETQPLPHALSWYAHFLPGVVLRAATAAMFFIELVLPFAVFLPRRPRLAAFLGVNLLMVLITLTGNYTFFNVLALVLSAPLLDDSQWGRVLPFLRARLGTALGRAPEPRARRALAAVFALFVVPVSLAAGLVRVFPGAASSGALRGAAAAGQTLNLVNAYGLFAVMTRPRREILIEGSYDGKQWTLYEFRWKPGDPGRRPGWVQPHQPRLDWQMWFAALAPYQRSPWYLQLLTRLLEGSEPVRRLFSDPPFAGKPPTYLRSVLMEYRFAPPGSPGGGWWERRVLGLFAPIVTLGPDGRLKGVELPP